MEERRAIRERLIRERGRIDGMMVRFIETRDACDRKGLRLSKRIMKVHTYLAKSRFEIVRLIVDLSEEE